MKHYDCIFLDRDGTLNPDPGYISSIDYFSFFDFTISALKKMSNKGNRFCILTNQSGVGRGLIDQAALDEIHVFIRAEFKKNEIYLLDIYYCTDHPEEASERRKPGPGMFLEAEMDHDLNLLDCLIIGDSVADIEAGEMLGMDTMLVLTGRGKETLDYLPEYEQPTYVVEDLAKGAEKLCP
ncbi:MAG: HAD-IIIA family hydrolase [Candidatus Neomarinimicrobiota bacterium]|nr:HAD-IIIA family hydrolase [Candidatus Neomarinimicrobiota bacterium]